MAKPPIRQMLLIVFALGLSACSAAGPTATATALASSVTVTLPAPTQTFTPEPTKLQTSFTPAVYTDAENGFMLAYPADWTLVPNRRIGDRGSQAQLFSPGATLDELPAGGTRVTISIYAWDPQNDLAAYVAQRKTAWEASNLKILDENPGQLPDGIAEMHFIVQSPDGQQTYILLTAWGQNYLQIAGDGELTLIDEISHTLSS